MPTRRLNGTAAGAAGSPQEAALLMARNLRRWRISRGITATALAERAGVAKSTVSLIERGEGNPSIDTVWALSRALGVAPAALFEDAEAAADVEVVRAADTRALHIPNSETTCNGLVARHMLTRSGGSLIELYHVVYQDDDVHEAAAHAPGLYEHISVVSGTLEVWSEDFREVLGEGDLISFRADRPHGYRAIEGPVRMVCVQEYPQTSEQLAAADPAAIVRAAVESTN